MRSLLISLCAIAGMVLLTACGNQATAPTPGAKPAAGSEQKTEAPKEEGKPEGTAQPVAPLVEAAKQPEQAAVEIKAVDTATGKVVDMVFKTIYFDFDKYNIKPEFQSAIEQNAALVKSVSSLKLIIEGHCDERGTTEYNLALGEHRAAAVMKAMIAAGAGKDQLKTISYGKERPVDPGHNEAAWAKNRRAVPRNAAG